MRKHEILTAVRGILLAQMLDEDGQPIASEIIVRPQPQQVGIPSGPALFIDWLGEYRYGHMSRFIEPENPQEPLGPKVLVEKQYFETYLQFTALSNESPNNPDFSRVYLADDIAREASAVLQRQAGLDALADYGMRPLRIGRIRDIPILNDANQYSSDPSFDLTLVRAEEKRSKVGSTTEINITVERLPDGNPNL